MRLILRAAVALHNGIEFVRHTAEHFAGWAVDAEHRAIDAAHDAAVNAAHAMEERAARLLHDAQKAKTDALLNFQNENKTASVLYAKLKV